MSTHPIPPQVTRRQTLAETRCFRIEEMDLSFSNGEQRCYERLRSNGHGAVLVVPMLDADTVLLIREYSAGVERYELAMVKGRMEAGECPEEAANRELMEEAGYGARRLKHLTTLSLAPGYFSHQTHIVLAEDLYPQREEGDEPEPLEVVPWSLQDLDGLLAQDDFTESRSIAALLLVLRHLGH